VHSAIHQVTRFIRGIIALVKQVRQIVLPTVLYQSKLKSEYFPVKIGNPLGKLITEVQFAL
jgi:hypothetical protein